MREIILDTETTGLNPLQGHRIVEIGAIELFNHLPTGKNFHTYINPQRDMPREAEAVHGLSSEFLKTKPVFSTIAQEFIDFIGESTLVIHNASFDMSFLNTELDLVKKPMIPDERVIDTLMMARKRFPSGPNSLDALCKRFGVDNSKRTKHGALLDAELLADVYLELLGGRQINLTLAKAEKQSFPTLRSQENRQMARSTPLESRLTETEQKAHLELIKLIGLDASWLKKTRH